MTDISFAAKRASTSSAGIDQSIIVGHGRRPELPWLTVTTQVFLIVDGFTITRAGNNPVDWNNPNALNNQGISFGGPSGQQVPELKVTGNRNGILAQSTTR
ncbi:MAG: hypothetical protein IPI85_02105 [Dehalococcoidia bacterium]|nr:hypothetical protein [Dehalococcoidia bacterium]